MAEDEPARAMVDWANSAPPADLAAELMAAFGVPELGWDSKYEVNGMPLGRLVGVGLQGLIDWLLFRGRPGPRTPRDWYRALGSSTTELEQAVLEALQVLEHAELILEASLGTEAGNRWAATRLGLADLASGKAVVRQRIKDRSGV
jgi:hypothetical protein